MNHLDEHADTQPLLRAYLKDLDVALSGIPRSRRKHLIGEIRLHVGEALAEQPPRSPAEMRSLLDRVGQPEEIAAAARQEEPEPARVWQRALVAGISVLVLGGLGPGLYIALTTSRSSRPPAAAGPGSHHATVAPTPSPTPAARPSASPSQTSAPAVVAQPSGPPVTRTADLRAILPPATVPPVSNECTLPVTFDADGNVSPLTCAGGGVDATAWNWYASGDTSTLENSELLRLGLYANPGQVYQAMCYDYVNVYKTKPTTERAEEIAQTYYGWQFAGDNPLQDFEQLGCPPPS